MEVEVGAQQLALPRRGTSVRPSVTCGFAHVPRIAAAEGGSATRPPFRGQVAMAQTVGPPAPSRISWDAHPVRLVERHVGGDSSSRGRPSSPALRAASRPGSSTCPPTPCAPGGRIDPEQVQIGVRLRRSQVADRPHGGTQLCGAGGPHQGGHQARAVLGRDSGWSAGARCRAVATSPPRPAAPGARRRPGRRRDRARRTARTAPRRRAGGRRRPGRTRPISGSSTKARAQQGVPPDLRSDRPRAAACPGGDPRLLTASLSDRRPAGQVVAGLHQRVRMFRPGFGERRLAAEVVPALPAAPR